MNELRKSMIHQYREAYLNGVDAYKNEDQWINVTLHAVIEALPEKFLMPETHKMGYDRAIGEVITILTAAKSPDRDQVKEGADA